MTRDYQVDSILRCKFNCFIVRTYYLETVIKTVFLSNMPPDLDWKTLEDSINFLAAR